MVLDAEQAAADLAAGRVGCPHCGGTLTPWASARTRPVRLRDGSHRLVRPRRGRCGSCPRRPVLLPAWCPPPPPHAGQGGGAAPAPPAPRPGPPPVAPHPPPPP